MSLRDVRVPGRLALDGLEVSATDRLLVTGGNGTGKSTLLAGRLPAEGDVHRRRRLTVGLLTQDTVFEGYDRTVRDTYELSLGPERTERVPPSWGTWTNRSDSCPWGSVGGWRRHYWWPTRRGSSCSMNPPTTSPRGCATNWSPHWVRAPARSSWPATIAGCADGGRAANFVWNRDTADERRRRRPAAGPDPCSYTVLTCADRAGCRTISTALPRGTA